jgi:hypothetical protein
MLIYIYVEVKVRPKVVSVRRRHSNIHSSFSEAFLLTTGCHGDIYVLICSRYEVYSITMSEQRQLLQ